MIYNFKVPEDKKIDVIIDTDAKNEADDQYAIVHALLSPKLNVLGLVSTHFSKRRTLTSMEDSYGECKKLVDLMDDPTPVFKGNIEELHSTVEFEVSKGVEFIIEQAHRAKDTIHIAALGALTNVAAALLHDPSIKNKITLIWVGGKTNFDDDYCREANAGNDYLAMNVVMEMCDNIIHIPAETYSRMQVSLAELEIRVQPYHQIGNYLFQQLVDFNYFVNRYWSLGESWCMGDTAAISLLINRQSGVSIKRNAFTVDSDCKITNIDKQIDMVVDIDSRYAMEDFYSKLYLFAKHS